LCASSRVGSSGRLVGVEDTINNVDNTVGDENIRNDDLGLVDKDSAVVDSDVELCAIGSGQSTVLEVAAVANSAVDDVVRKNVGEVTLAGIGENRTNLGKSAVVGNKDSDVLLTGKVGQNLGLSEGASSGGKVGGDGRVGKVHRDGENTVDDVNNTSSEVEILESQKGQCYEWIVTYSLGDIGLSTETTVEADSIVHGHGLDALSTSDVGVCRVGQVCRNEGSHVHVGDVAGIVGAVQDVVRQKVGDIAGVVVDHASNGGVLEELLEGIVTRGQDGDISKTAKVSKKAGLSGDETCEGQHTK
jgi:hypothetical protein